RIDHGGNGEPELRPGADPAVDADLFAVRLDDGLGDGEAEADAARVAASRLPHPAKDLPDLVFGDPRPLVRDAHPHFSVHLGRADDDSPTRRTEFDGVADEVGKDLND